MSILYSVMRTVKMSVVWLVLLLVVLAATPTTRAGVFVVTNTADAGVGSLRQAITDANALVGADTINFNIPGSGLHTISPASALPTITGPVTIDGYMQPGAAQNTAAAGFNGILLIELNGTNAGVGVSALTITAGNSTVRGLVINRFDGVGINLNSADNVVAGNFIGTNAAGTAALGNGSQAIRVDSGNSNLIGGTTPETRNIISGNDEGMEIRGVCDANMVQGNFVGTNAAGTAALGNTSNGVRITNGPTNTIVGGTTAGARNVISGNGGDGVDLEAPTSGNLVEGNFIGTDVTGTLDLGNTFNGVRITAQGNTVGGTTAAARNVISGNDENGVGINSGASGNLVQGNYIGTDVNGTANLGNAAVGVYIFDAASNTIGGTAVGARNIISGNALEGMVIDTSASTANIVQGNYIGTDVTGLLDLGNGTSGVTIKDAPGNTIGGSATGAGNVISGNGQEGVFITGATAENNQISQNLIGRNAANDGPLGNDAHGIFLISSGPNTIGGGFNPNNANVIAHNAAAGVGVFFGSGPCIKKGIISNSIFANGGLGIDLGDDGVTPNDPGDPDTGANTLQNFPVLTSVTTSDGNTTIEGTLNSTADTSFYLEFFASEEADPSGFGEGQTFLGSTNVTTDSVGDAAFTAVLPVLPPPGQIFISSTASDNAELANTSEFSQVIQIAPDQLLNISTRLRVLTADNVLIGGFIITGTNPKQVIVRAIGPSLTSLGVQGALADPILELHFSDGSVVSNDNWRATQEQEIIDTTIPPTSDLESAIVATLDPGNYTAIVRGKNNGTGVALVEAYDLDRTMGRLANISTRGFVDTGENVMIGGFIIGGDTASDILLRGIGPSLTNQGVPGALGDPTLELHDGDGNTLTSNDDWKDSQQTEIEATTIPPTDGRESALVATLAPGAYTVIMGGKNATTGVGLVEVYNLR